ncbi:MAG: hypothetical protein AAF192_09445, partial [Pseudomonadota bacterium]
MKLLLPRNWQPFDSMSDGPNAFIFRQVWGARRRRRDQIDNPGSLAASRGMARDLPKKLRLTLSALGCRTQKELLGKLLTVNPQTAFTPDKAYKWMSGAATPRDPAIYADLAAALGLDGGAAAFRDGALEAFEAALRARHPHLALAADASSAEVATRSTTVHA